MFSRKRGKMSYPEPPKDIYYWKRRIKAKYLTWNSERLCEDKLCKSFWRRPACQETLSKASDISSAAAQVAPDLLKALAILSDTTVRRSTVDLEDVKPYWELEKRLHFCRCLAILLFTSFSVTLLTTERPFFNILKYRGHQWDLLTTWKTRLLQTHIEEFI